jgi:DNA (cytosine-5)-methyltransferase 1
MPINLYYPVNKSEKKPFIRNKRKNIFTFIDLFAGIGGIRIAFENVGGKCVFTSEWDENCKKTYSALFGEIPYGDIKKINKYKIPNHDVLVAGFPCQPFSSFGKREGFKHKTQGTLFYDIAETLSIKKTPVFLRENVEGLVKHNGKKTFNIFKTILSKELNYNIFTKILDAADYGVPQYRKRIYIVGFSNNLFPNNKKIFNFPTSQDNRNYIGKYVEKNITGYSISKHLQRSYLFKKKDGNPELINRESKIRVKTLVASYHKIQRLTGTFVIDGPTKYRLLTENECKAIMGFPKRLNNYKFPVSRTQMYRQLGNSVAVPVINAIAKEIVKTMLSEQL